MPIAPSPKRPPLVQTWMNAPVQLVDLTDYEIVLLQELGWIDNELAVTDDCPSEGNVYDIDLIMDVARAKFPTVVAEVARHTS